MPDCDHSIGSIGRRACKHSQRNDPNDPKLAPRAHVAQPENSGRGGVHHLFRELYSNRSKSVRPWGRFQRGCLCAPHEKTRKIVALLASRATIVSCFFFYGGFKTTSYGCCKFLSVWLLFCTCGWAGRVRFFLAVPERFRKVLERFQRGSRKRFRKVPKGLEYRQTSR